MKLKLFQNLNDCLTESLATRLKVNTRVTLTK